MSTRYVYDYIQEELTEMSNWQESLLEYKLIHTSYDKEVYDESFDLCLTEIFSVYLDGDELDQKNKENYLYTPEVLRTNE